MDRVYEIVAGIGWSFLIFLLTMCLLALFMVLYSLHQYLRDRNQREAALERMRMLQIDSMRKAGPEAYMPVARKK